MPDRKLDYYNKGLSIETRQNLFYHFKHSISETMMKCFLERESDYRSFHASGFTDENIRQIWDDVYIKKISEVNHIREMNHRPHLFSNPSDSYQSAKEYFELMKIRDEEELREIFGCSFEEYIPEVL